MLPLPAPLTPSAELAPPRLPDLPKILFPKSFILESPPLNPPLLLDPPGVPDLPKIFFPKSFILESPPLKPPLLEPPVLPDRLRIVFPAPFVLETLAFKPPPVLLFPPRRPVLPKTLFPKSLTLETPLLPTVSAV